MSHLGSFCFPSLSLSSTLNCPAPPPIDDRPQKVQCRDGKYEFLRSQYLGAGTYGMVYKAQDCATKQTVVIKQMKVFDTDDLSMQPTTIREVSLLRSIHCRHIIQLLGTFWTRSDDFCLVFEYCSMDLAKFMATQQCKITAAMVRKWAYQMLSGLRYLHAHRIMHRDLKPQNLLLSFAAFDIKIADFGLGKEFSLPIQSATMEVVTLWYRAPELLLGCHRYNAKIDVWSVGCILVEVVNMGRPLFDGYCEWEMLMRIFQFLGTPDLQLHAMHLKHFNSKFPKFKCKKFKSKLGLVKEDKLACDLIKSMLTLDWSKRLNANQLLQHPWFEGYEGTNGAGDNSNSDLEAVQNSKHLLVLYQNEYAQLPQNASYLIDFGKRFGITLQHDVAQQILADPNQTIMFAECANGGSSSKIVASENRLMKTSKGEKTMGQPFLEGIQNKDNHSKMNDKKVTKRNRKRKQMGVDDDDDDGGARGYDVAVDMEYELFRKKRKTV